MYDLNISRRDIGVNFVDGEALVKVWAPQANHVQLKAHDKILDLSLQQHGLWSLNTRELQPETDYVFLVDGTELPDPASLCQPYGVHGHSRAMDLNDFEWTDHDWLNIPLDDYIIYELHVGTFTNEGSFMGVAAKLAHLKALGVTAIEIMPVAQFPGDRNWGYDGVFPFAVQNSYGSVRGLQQLIDQCHAYGLAVILDVVYNHIGPEGNILRNFGPYFTSKYQTPWGDAINFDDYGSDFVRQYFIENALMWLRDFHVDALRLDAVHAIKDFGPSHILRDIRACVDALIHSTWRMHYLIAEVDLNDTRYVNPVETGGYGMDAQWIDEFHHALRVTTGQQQLGYYKDFNGIDDLAKAYQNAYVYDGQYSEHRGKYFGTPTHNLAGNKFVVFSQNHDQVGNRMLGERSSELVSFSLLKVMAGATILSPYIPLLFMGEEYGELNPFLYFVHHSDPVLIENVREGRKKEFAAFHNTDSQPDAQDKETFDRSRLNWSRTETGDHQMLLQFYQELIRLRKLNPALRHLDRNAMEVVHDSTKRIITMHRWHGQLHVWEIINFSSEPQKMTMPASRIHIVLNSDDFRWKGSGLTRHEMSDSSIILAPESLAVYTNQHD